MLKELAQNLLPGNSDSVNYKLSYTYPIGLLKEEKTMKAIILPTIMCFSTSSVAAYDCVFLDYCEANMSCSLNELSEASLGERNQICRSQQPDVKPDILSNSIEKSK